MEVRFGPSSRRFLDSQPQNIRSKLINDVVRLSDNPYLRPDEPSISPFLAAPVVIRHFEDDFHWMLFYLENDTLILANIGNISEPPHLYRAPDR